MFLLQNFFMDFVAVTGVNYFLKRRKKYTRLAITALLSSAAGLALVLFVRNYVIYRLLSHFLLNTLMVCLCFGIEGRKAFLENWAVTYFAVILLGGLFQWLQAAGIVPSGFLMQATAAALLGYLALLYLMQKKSFGNHIFSAEIRKDSRSVRLCAYWDSGNQLTDPYSGQAVSIISREKAAVLMDDTKDLVRYVPFCSLGAKEGLLAVTSVDELLIYDGSRTIRTGQTAIGIAEKGLLEGRDYDLILHASLL